MDNALALRVPHAGPDGRGSPRYDVCLSFPGGSDASPDPSFLRRLLASLATKGVSVCGPDATQAVCSSPQLPDAFIPRSKICIPIFSKDYASNKRCLRELVQVMEGKRSAGQMVLPIFDRVEPSDMRYRKGSFQKAILPFDGEEIERVETELFEASHIYGWRMTDWPEEELVERVVQTVLRCLRPDLHNVSQSARYNVFLSFRGVDARHDIAYRLYTGLVGAGVSVFKDDTDLPIGEDFRSQLLSTISRSTIYVIVISPNYGSSKWCLGELAQFMEYKKSAGHVLLPIFSQVKPYEVRELLGSFGRAFSSCKRHLGPGAVRHAAQTLRSIVEHRVLGDSYFSDDETIRKVVDFTFGQLRHHFQVDVPEHMLRRYDVTVPLVAEYSSDIA